MKLNFSQFVGWVFQALLLAVGSWGVSELSALSESVQQLNVKMAVVLERDANRSNEILEIKSRLVKLEDK